MTTIRKLAVQLSAGEISARQLVDQSLDRISDPAGEGGRAFLSVAADKARLTADTYDTLRRNGGVVLPSPASRWQSRTCATSRDR